MNEKEFIGNLSKKIADYNTPEQAISQANSCDSLSNDIYTDSKRFIYELLQNADDACNKKEELIFQIDFCKDYIIVSHNGDAFSESDIKSICSIGDGNKKSDENKTGFKGIGFKSVFAYSDYVIIKSGNYCFKFDKLQSSQWNEKWGKENSWKAERKADNKDDEIKMPWQIIPIWTEIPEEFKNIPAFVTNKFTVSTIIRHNQIEKLKNDLKELFSTTQIVLFLRNKRIKIIINDEETVILEKTVENNATILKRNDEILSEWLIKTFQFDIPDEVHNHIKNNNNYPRKLRDSERTEMSFAIQLENEKLKACDKDKRLIFTYLPTSINYDLPFLVNANFLTDAGRENIHKDLEWNQWLFKQMPLKYFSWIAELANKSSKYNRQFLNIIPFRLNGFTDLERCFNEGYNTALSTIAFIPNINRNLIKVSEALFDETDISNFINKQILIDYINNNEGKNFSISSFITPLQPTNNLRSLGIYFFEIKDLSNLFINKIFRKGHKLSENFDLITFLYKRSQKYKNDENKFNEWMSQLKATPFILDEDKKLRKPKDIYFPSVEFSDEFSNDIHIINKTVFKEVSKNQNIKNWLEKLGVEEPTDISFIKKTIIGQSDFITQDNAIEVGQYLFRTYQKGLLEDYYEDLHNFKIVTKQRNLINACEAFLSDFYEPEMKIEKYINDDLFISEEYYIDRSLKSEWKIFFLRIGISDDITWKENIIEIDNIEKRRDYNFFEPYIERFESSEFYTMSARGYTYVYTLKKLYVKHFSQALEITKTYMGAKLFWNKAFKKEYYIEEGLKALGAHGIYDDNEFIKEADYFVWTIDNLELFPTKNKECHKASDIYNNNNPELNEIAGKYLPILDYDGIVSPKWRDILKFKERIGLTDYLKILTEISQDHDLSEDDHKINKKRVCLIYDKIGELLNVLHPTEKDELQKWADNNKIMAKDGNFYSPKELSLVRVEGFNANNLIYYPEKRINDGIINLFRLWDVQIIDKNTIKATFSNSMSSMNELKECLENIAPFIALASIGKLKDKNKWEKENQRIKDLSSKISFYETTGITISYGNEQDKQERSTWAEENNFYYIGNWYKPRVLDGLVDPLCDFLKINRLGRMLSVLLLEGYSDNIKYMEENGYDISFIPIEQNTAFSPTPLGLGGNDITKDVGKKGEIFVFDELKKIYKKKYSQPIEEFENGFSIDGKLKVTWYNKQIESCFNYDFKINEDNKEIYIDSKATTSGKNAEKVALYISGNELDLMESAEKYLIARVYNVTSDEPSVEFVRLEKENIK